jgi:hypothetical protein
MGTLFFVCPTTGMEVSSGIEIDADSYKELPNGLSEILCPKCRQRHVLSEVGARLAQAGLSPCKATQGEG